MFFYEHMSFWKVLCKTNFRFEFSVKSYVFQHQTKFWDFGKMFDFEVYNVRNIAKILLKHCKNIAKTCLKHAQNIPGTWPTHAQNMPETYPKHGQNIAKSCPKHSQIMPKTFPKHCWLLRNQHILGQNIAYCCEIDIFLAKTLVIVAKSAYS